MNSISGTLKQKDQEVLHVATERENKKEAEVTLMAALDQVITTNAVKVKIHKQ